MGPNQQECVSMMKKDYMEHMQRPINEGRACDDVSGMELELKRVKQARQEEMRFFEKRKAYTRCKRDRVAAEEGKLIDVRWIDVNKGDEEHPNYWSRLVGREFNTYKDDSLYAATPPLEALRAIVSQAATNTRRGERQELMVNDISRAYFYARLRGHFVHRLADGRQGRQARRGWKAKRVPVRD